MSARPWLVLCLSGCVGASADSYLTVGYGSPDLDQGATLHAVDTAAPQKPPAFSDAVLAPLSYVTSTAFAVDPATQARTRLGSARLVYVKAGRLLTISLRR